MKCHDCGEPLTEKEVAVSGLFCLCEKCARWHSNRIYDKLMSFFESEEDVYRMAFAKYGIDDFAYCVDREIDNG